MTALAIFFDGCDSRPVELGETVRARSEKISDLLGANWDATGIIGDITKYQSADGKKKLLVKHCPLTGSVIDIEERKEK